MAQAKPETAFRRQCIDWLKIRFKGEFWELKIAGGSYQRPGSPDTICCIRGLFVAMEWKDPARDGAKASAKQQEVIDEIQAAKGRAHCVRSWAELWEAVKDIPPVFDVQLPAVQRSMAEVIKCHQKARNRPVSQRKG